MGADPNLFIVGAPKCGTTALSRYLTAHPDVFVANRELNYFSVDLEFRTMKGEAWRITPEAYRAWFAEHPDVRYRGDHSVFYLYSSRAAAEIRAFDPDARILVMLRNPVDQMHSEHSEMLFQGDEDERDFATALSLEEARRQGRHVPPHCRKVFGLFYRDLARYSDQVERYFAAFGRHRVCVVLHDDLVADVAGAYRRVLEFLDVDPEVAPDFSVVNANKVVRSTALRELLRRTPALARRAGRLVVRDEHDRAALRRRLQAMNTKEQARPAVDPELRRRLEEEFEPEVRRLEALLGRDLPAWRSAPAPSA
ncbi:MAG TPA: sulfotransferase [Acidimicrobiales bacterium]|nr:sulfotransferase [Acidimicrobiales bacterium]